MSWLAVKRIGWLGLIVFFGISALVAAAPPTEPQPDFGRPGEDLATLSAAGVWYCPWAQADASRDGFFALAVTGSASGLLSLPHPIPGEPADTEPVTFSGPGSQVLAVSDMALRGHAPGFVEMTETGVGVSVVIENEDVLAGDACLAALPKVWHLPGGSTLEGQRLVLRLFNPFPETARVDVVAVSEFGTEPLPELAARAVPGRSWDDIELQDKLRLRQSLSFTISTTEGVVIPAVLLANEADEAIWTGSSLATSWEFPLTGNSVGEAVLTVTNPGTRPVTVAVEVFTPEGPIPGPDALSIVEGASTLLPLAGLSEGPLGVRLDADGPIAASVVAIGADGLGGTLGVAEPAPAWLLPGAGAGRGLVSVWLLNTGETDATVTVADLDDSGYLEKVAVPGQTLRRVTVSDVSLQALRVDSTQPIAVAWSAADAESLMFVAAIAP